MSCVFASSRRSFKNAGNTGSLSDGDWLVQIQFLLCLHTKSADLGVIKIRWQFLAFQFFELFYLFDLAFDITVIFNVDIYLFADIRCQVWTLRIYRCKNIIVQFRTADQLSSVVPVFKGWLLYCAISFCTGPEAPRCTFSTRCTSCLISCSFLTT